MSTMLPMKVVKGTGRPLVLLHGLGNNHRSWKYVLDALNYDYFEVFVPDLLGFGDAPKPDTDYTVNDHAAAVIAALETHGVKDAVVAGHSMGCNVAIEVARRRPDLVKHLVLLGAPLYKTMPKKRRLRRLLHIEGTYFTIFDFLKHNPDMTITAAKAADKFLPLLHGMEITEETWMPFCRSLNNTIMQTKSFKDTAKLQVPTLFVYGLLDMFVSKSNLKKAVRKNRRYLHLKTTLGPHEITPLQGKKIATMLKKVS